MICPTCGTDVQIGDWPFCKGGHVKASPHIQDDTLPGGARWMHNLGDHPVWVETKTQYQKELASRGLMQKEQVTYNRDDRSPWATRTRLRVGAHDPFIGKDKTYRDTFKDTN